MDVLYFLALSDPTRVAGWAEFDDSRATARDVLLIALAGTDGRLALDALRVTRALR